MIAELERICQVRGIRRFSPEEMVELLKDGETVEWIVAQVLPEPPGEAARELTAVLKEIAVQVAPAPSATKAQEEISSTGGQALESLDWNQLRDLPLPPGVDLHQLEKLLSSPQGALLADFSAFCQEQGLKVEGEVEGMKATLQALQEQWLQTPRESLEGKTPAEVLQGNQLLPRKVETFRRETPKVGRNDPCPCGSGKKYKKCCGRER